MRFKRSVMSFIIYALVLGVLCSNFAFYSFAESTEKSIIDEEEKQYSKANIDDEFAEDRIIVMMNNQESLECKEYLPEDFPEVECFEVIDLIPDITKCVEAKMNGIDPQTLFDISKDAVIFEDFYDINLDNFHRIICLMLVNEGKEQVLEAMNKLEERPDIYFVEPDYFVKTCATTTDDTYVNNQWAINAIELPKAWDIVTGSSTVYVGVVDSGIDATHPDLAANLDTSKGWTYNSSYPPYMDGSGHGTHVAGIIGAVADNGKGVAGTNWNVKLVSLRMFDETGMAMGGLSRMTSAINYAVSQGICIINISASEYAASADDRGHLPGVIQSFNGLVICSAGNDGVNLNSNTAAYYPAKFNYDNVITVGASDSYDNKCVMSNYGDAVVDVFAPGASILSCYPTSLCQQGNCGNGHYATGYHHLSGTSMAAPYVTGIVALLLAENPNLTRQEIRDAIMDTVDYPDILDPLSNYCVSGGRVNAYNAVMAVHAHSYTNGYYWDSAIHAMKCRCGACSPNGAPHTFVLLGNGRRMCSVCGYLLLS